MYDKIYGVIAECLKRVCSLSNRRLWERSRTSCIARFIHYDAVRIIRWAQQLGEGPRLLCHAEAIPWDKEQGGVGDVADDPIAHQGAMREAVYHVLGSYSGCW